MSVETVTQQISSAYHQLRQAHADLLEACNLYHAEARANYEHRVQQLEVDAPNLRFALADWNDAAWATYAPGTDAPLSSAVRVGCLEQAQNGYPSDLPALLALIGRNHILIEGEDPKAARRLLQQILLRVVLAAPPGSVRVNLTDPVGGGSNLGSLLYLPAVLRNDKKPATRTDEIEKLLDSLVTHIETVVQTRLLSAYATIEDYNAGQPEMTLPYQFLALPDMPTGFTDRAWERLRFIAENAIAAGVYVIGSSSEEAKAERAQWAETTAGWTTLTIDREDRLEWRDAVFGALAARLDDPPSAVQVNGWCRALERALDRAETNISFSRVAIPTARRWRGNSTDELRVPIGVDSKGSVQEFSLGKTNFHALVGGMTGYGKSKLLDVLITQLSLAYSPDEVAFYLVDLREGVGFQDYVRLPHVRAISLENEREFGLNMLRHLQGEFQRRSELFKAVGSGVENLAQYRTITGNALPRILLIIDEFQVLFTHEDSIAREAGKILEDIARRGRGFGIHIMLCSQSPRATGFSHGLIFSQVGLRIAFRCDENVSQAILGEGNDAASELEQPGEAIYNPALGSRARNTRIQVALLDPPERQQLLDEIRAATGEDLPPPITFESKSSARLQDNPELQAALSQPGWQPRRRTARLWLGQPIEIKAPTAAELMRYAGSNLLIAGGDETQAHGLLVASIFSLAAQHSPRELRVIATDFAPPESPVEGLFQQVKAAIPHPVEIVRPRQAASSLDSLLETVTQRLDDESPADTTICFCIAGMQRWRELRPADAFGQTEAGKQLTRLLEEGADVGVHVLAWTDTVASLERAIKRSGLGSFDLRIGLRLSESDSNTLLGTPGAARFEGNRALFRSEDWEAGRVEKFKPYPVPGDAAITALGARLHAKGEV